MALSLPIPIAPQASLGDTDWFGVGLVLAIIGSFLLANAILFRHPRSLVQEHFRGARPRLQSIRDYVFHRVQVHLGFLFLLVGFGLQLYGHYRPRAPLESPEFPVFAVGVVVLLVVAFEIAGWWLSHALFRRYVRDYFLRHPPDFDTDIELAREVGGLFGMRSSGDETVQSYVARLRRELGLPEPGRRGRPPVVEGEPEEDLA